MTAQEIADRTEPDTPERIEKAKALALRMRVDWATVQAILDAKEK